MGLRIIDRSIPEGQRLNAAKAQFSYWAERRGVPTADSVSELLKHYQSVRERLTESDKVAALAEVMHQRINAAVQENSLPHKEIDIATVLELLQD